MTGTSPHATACDEMRLLIQADQDGELDAAAASVLAAHVRDCPGCAALARDLARLGSTLRRSLREEAAPDHLRAALEAHLAAAPARRGASSRSAGTSSLCSTPPPTKSVNSRSAGMLYFFHKSRAAPL